MKQLRPDLVKIDRSFVSALDTDSSAHDILGSLVGLSHSLGIRVVAEGVESADQLAAVRAAGCDLFQGFYLGRPCSAAELANSRDVTTPPAADS
ncbi:MAG: EAL domain-containing protein [Acidimicrobiales bacterium]